jgi:hypothetical protein
MYVKPAIIAARCLLAGRTAPPPHRTLGEPMELLKTIAGACRRLRARIDAWRDEVAARPIDPAGWWR